MIVICTKCQAKFRVADEKIGPRGAKVRCSKCQTVFLVHQVLGTVPVTDGDARHVARAQASAPTSVPPPEAAPPPPDPFAAADPFAAPAPPRDPFTAVPADLFGRPAAPAPAPDPFGGADPFAAAPPPAPAQEGGAPASLGDPFVATVSHRTTLPVTDLSDLMGPPAAAAPPPLPGAAAGPPPFPPAAPDLDDPFAAPAAAPPVPAAPPAPAPAFLEDPFATPPAAEPAAAPEAPALADPFASADPFAAAAPPEGAPGPDLDLATPAPAPHLDVGGLSLEDRLTPPPSRLGPAATSPLPDPTLETAELAPGPSAAIDPFAGLSAGSAAGAGEPFDPGAFDFGAEPAAPLGGPEPEAAPQAAPQAAPAAPPPAAPPPSAPAPRAATGTSSATLASTPGADAAAAAAAARIPGARTSRLRTAAVNAVALITLLAVALALWAVWRAEGPFEAASLRPSAILAALGRGSTSGPWAAQDVRSGVYDRARGAPLLFVRGRVVSRGSSPAVPAVKVAVQVVRGGQVLARGEALAGAVPTAEELYLATDDAAVAAAARAALSRAPAAVRPGDAVPFLVAMGDAPADLEGATLRIDVAPAGGGAP